jgi:Fur family ferric uptake transcriptional regulator
MKTEEEIKIARQRFEEFLKAKKMRKTEERFQILEYIYLQPALFDVAELHQKMQDQFRVSLATIYYTIDLLLQCNLIIRHTFDSQNIKYEKTPFGSTNYYRICMQCSTVKAFSELKLKKSIAKRNFSTFTPLHHSLYVYGICKKCEQKNKKDNR